MDRFWIVTPWLVDAECSDALAELRPLLNAQEVFEARQPSGTVWRNFPRARLRLPVERFATDCFALEGCTFVSERLRSAMALSPEAAQFFDVDLSECSEAVRASDYKIMNVSTLEDAVDEWETISIAETKIATLAFGKAVKKGFRPANVIFHDRIVRGHVFCTDALAMRVLPAGCTSVRFFDPATLRFWPTDTFRTLRGLERQNQQTLETELVEEIA